MLATEKITWCGSKGEPVFPYPVVASVGCRNWFSSMFSAICSIRAFACSIRTPLNFNCSRCLWFQTLRQDCWTIFRRKKQRGFDRRGRGKETGSHIQASSQMINICLVVVCVRGRLVIIALFDCSVVCVCAKEHLQEFGMRKIKTERFMKSLNELKSEHIKLLCCLLLLLLLLFVLMLCVCA